MNGYRTLTPLPSDCLQAEIVTIRRPVARAASGSHDHARRNRVLSGHRASSRGARRSITPECFGQEKNRPSPGKEMTRAGKRVRRIEPPRPSSLSGPSSNTPLGFSRDSVPASARRNVEHVLLRDGARITLRFNEGSSLRQKSEGQFSRFADVPMNRSRPEGGRKQSSHRLGQFLRLGFRQVHKNDSL